VAAINLAARRGARTGTFPGPLLFTALPSLHRHHVVVVSICHRGVVAAAGAAVLLRGKAPPLVDDHSEIDLPLHPAQLPAAALGRRGGRRRGQEQVRVPPPVVQIPVEALVLVPAGHSRRAGLVAVLLPQKPGFHLLCLPLSRPPLLFFSRCYFEGIDPLVFLARMVSIQRLQNSATSPSTDETNKENQTRVHIEMTNLGTDPETNGRRSAKATRRKKYLVSSGPAARTTPWLFRASNGLELRGER
jgi:hypothetical protein